MPVSRVRISRVDQTLPLPEYQTAGAVGFDLLCREDVTVEPGEVAALPSNVIVRVPTGYVLIVALRSSTPRRKGLLCPHGVGIIDQDYYGPEDEVKVQVYNFSDEPVTVGRGERIAQGLLVPVVRVAWEESAPDADGSRGGFGSTG